VSDEIPPALSEFAVGSQIAGYRLEEQIGRGGMAVVFRAYDARLDRHVALKILSPRLALDDAFRHRFIRESRAAAAVDHPNIIPVFDAGETSGVLFIAMRFVHGRDLRTLLDRTGPLPPARASDIITQVASALDAAHARGLVHRDVKPANMLLDEDAGGERRDHVYLSDFGLTKHSLSDTGITSQGQVLGTLDYIAPEQIEGRAVDGRTDLYALACGAFELLSGAPPFKRSGGLAVVWAQLSEPPPPLTVRRPELPPAVDDVLARAMAKAPADRFARCGEFAAALRGALDLGSGESGRSAELPVPSPATRVAIMREGIPSGPAGDLPWAGEAAPAEAAVSVGRAASDPAAPAGGVQSIQNAGRPRDAAPAAESVVQEHVVSADDVTPPWGTPSVGGAPPTGSAASLWDVGRSQAAGSIPAVRSTTPGLTEPGVLQFEPGGYGRGGGPRAPWWRSRAAVSAAAAVVVLGIAGGAFALARGGGGGGRPAHGLVANVRAPAPTNATASARHLTSVQQQTITLGGNPFGVVVTPDGQYSFVSLGNAVAVLKNGSGSQAPARVATIPAPGAKKSLAVTPDGQYLLAAEGSGAYVINVKEAEAGNGGGAIMGVITAGAASLQSVEVSISPDSRFAFITLQSSASMAVFDLHEAIASGFRTSGLKGLMPVGSSPVGIAQSPNGRWLYVVSEVPSGGRLVVIDMHVAETNPMNGAKTSVAVGGGPARVIVSPDGSVIWVSDRNSNALVALSAAKLLSDPSHSIIAKVSVGANPIGLAFVKDGKEIVVADANLTPVPGDDNLALIDTQKARSGQPGALLGYISAGRTPRELALEPDGKTLLATDNNSGQLQVIDVGSLP
jgi:DNA-binding beta-propeller fold protein YncE/tRNA A-37 threonylcarbamoyl transferase component Bud32